MGYLKSIGTCFIYISLVLAIITFLPGLPPDAEFTEYSIDLPVKLTGKLGLNDRLNGAEILHEGLIKGAESFDSFNGQLYSGIHGGYVIKIDENKITPIVKFGNECAGIWQEEKCGRPLGLKFNQKGDLYVIDTYYGIYKVDVKTKQYQKVIDISKPIDGKVPQVPNSLDIAQNGDIYWTDSSTDFPLSKGIYTFLANPSGRLIRYNAAKKRNEVLLKNLGFANGVKLSDDESFVLVLESLTSRITKYNLKGPKAGQQEIFYKSLPGIPDNVHSDGQGGFLVTLIAYADSEHPTIPQSLIPHSNIRKMIARVLALLELPLKLIQDVYPNEYAERLKHCIGSFEPLFAIVYEDRVTVLRFNAKGEIVDAAYTSDEKMNGFSSAFIHKDHLWFGSPFVNYIARVPLKQAFPELQKTESSTRASGQKQAESPKARKVEVKPGVEKVSSVPHKVDSQPPPASATVQNSNANTKPSTEKTTSATPTTTTAPTTKTTAPTTTTTTAPTTTTKTPSTTPTTRATAPPTTTTTTTTTTTPKPIVQKTTQPPKATASNAGTAQKPVPTTIEKPVTSTTPKPPTTSGQSNTVKPSAASASKQASPQIKENVPANTKPTEAVPKKETVPANSAKPTVTSSNNVHTNVKPGEKNVKDGQHTEQLKSAGGKPSSMP